MDKVPGARHGRLTFITDRPRVRRLRAAAQLHRYATTALGSVKNDVRVRRFKLTI
jgi:hypothetical protein